MRRMTTRQTIAQVQPGWYPDPSGPIGAQRWWGGQRWTDHFVPPAPPRPAGQDQAAAFVKFALIALGLVGAGIAMFTEVSVASGTGLVWTGAILAGVGAIGAAMFQRYVGWGVRIVCILLALAAIGSAMYDQHQVQQKRNEINQILNGGY